MVPTRRIQIPASPRLRLRRRPDQTRGRPASAGAIPLCLFMGALVCRCGLAQAQQTNPVPEVEAVDVEVEREAARETRSQDTRSRATLDDVALERAQGQDLAEAMVQISGVTAARGTADGSKPVIRGLQERRLLVLFDGVRHESQKWGDDHATEIDAFAAGEIDVIKGAAGARFGPDALGGVVLVKPHPLRNEPGIGGVVQLMGVSNGNRGTGAFRLEGTPDSMPELSWRLEGNSAIGSALTTPTYVLGNTASQQWNVGASLRFQQGVNLFSLSYRHYDLKAGICYCVRNSSADDFYAQLDAPMPVGAENWTPSYTIDRPYQAVTHELAMARALVPIGPVGVLETTYAFQLNQREEFDQVRESVTGSQYSFTLRTHSLDVGFEHVSLGLGTLGALSGGAGVSGAVQENVYSGLPLIPNFRALSAGAYAFERLSKGAVSVDLGGRYDHQSRSSFLTLSAFERHLGRGTLTEDDCDRLDSAARCNKVFDVASASVGMLWKAVENRLDVKLNLSSASRFPNGDELYMNGSAPTFPVYALGDPSLGIETTWGASPTVGFRSQWLEAEASAYLNLIQDYIYFAPEIGVDGLPEFDVTIQGTFPRFTYRPVDVAFYGGEGDITVGPNAPVQLKVQASMVRATDRMTGVPLLFVPPDRIRASLSHSAPTLGPVQAGTVEVSGLWVAKQTRVDVNADLAPPPPAYFLLGASVGGELKLSSSRTLKAGLEANNLLNARYRDYTSLLRYYADEPGRELRLRLSLTF